MSRIPQRRSSFPVSQGVPHWPTRGKLFELTETLEPGGTVTANGLEESDSGLAINTADEFNVTDLIGTYRGRAAVELDLGDGVLAGSRGVAENYNNTNGYIITWLQPHALMIRAHVNGDHLGGETPVSIGLAYGGVMAPTGGILWEDVTQVANPFQRRFHDGDMLYAFWDEDADQWTVGDYEEDTWLAKAQSDWGASAYSGSPGVSVKHLVAGVETGDAFNLRLLETSSCDPNVREDDVVAYTWASGGAGGIMPICVSGYLDDKIGTVKMWSGTLATIPPGWYLCDGTNGTINLADRFVCGATSEGDVGDTGGYTYHGGGENDHSNHTLEGGNIDLEIIIQDHDPHQGYELFHTPIDDHPQSELTHTGPDDHEIAARSHEIEPHPSNEFVHYGPDPHPPLSHSTIDAHAASELTHEEIYPHTNVLAHNDHPTHDYQIGEAFDFQSAGTADGDAFYSGEFVEENGLDLSHNEHNDHSLYLTHNELDPHGPLEHNQLDDHPSLTHTEIPAHGPIDHNIEDHTAITLTHTEIPDHGPLVHSEIEPHGPLTHSSHVVEVAQIDLDSATLSHTQTDNRPLYYKLAFIQRID